MATWNDLKLFIRGNYKITEEKDDLIVLLFDLGNLRSQLALIHHVISENNVHWVQISSPVGEIPLDSLNYALEKLDNRICGGLVKIGARHFVRHNLQLGDLSIDEFTVPLRVIVGTADELESGYVGGDEH
jgi:hypothetical protein